MLRCWLWWTRMKILRLGATKWLMQISYRFRFETVGQHLPRHTGLDLVSIRASRRRRSIAEWTPDQVRGDVMENATDVIPGSTRYPFEQAAAGGQSPNGPRIKSGVTSWRTQPASYRARPGIQ